MSPVIRNILVVALGIIVGGLVNILLIKIGSTILPLKEGLSMTSKNSEIMADQLSWGNYLSVFVAHAVGTLTGSWIVAKLGVGRTFRLVLIIGIFFLIGGITMVLEIKPPWLFSIIDLGLAYLPMSWLGYKLAGKSLEF